jgi:Flp pilus assembly protein TadG
MRRRRPDDQRGSAPVELTLLAPLLLVILLFVVGLGRMAHASQEVEEVSADAARAASLERNTAASQGVARSAARDGLGRAGLSCASVNVDVDVSNYRPGGTVRVTVTCTARMSDVALAGFPGHRRFTSTSIVPIEMWRAQ